MSDAVGRRWWRCAAALIAALALGSHANASTPRVRHPRLLLDAVTLERLRASAVKREPQWLALRSQCDRYLDGTVNWPDGDPYPGGGSIGAGYQGSGYLGAILNLGLCYQVTRRLDPHLARRYAAIGATVLDRMSQPPDTHAAAGDCLEAEPHFVSPLHDDGYGVRNYGVGMAVGYDWLNDVLSAEERRRVASSLRFWIDALEGKACRDSTGRDYGGFGLNNPAGNYFAAYYAAKALAALALDGQTEPWASRQWADWLRLQRHLVVPYFHKNLSGGGWPEGWNYGALATVNMTVPVLAAHTAKGMNLVGHRSGFSFPLSSADYVMHLSWPSLATVNDSGAQYAGDNPSAQSPGTLYVLEGALQTFGSPLAAPFRSFTSAAVRSVGRADACDLDRCDLAWRMLYTDDRAPASDYRRLPLAYVARGMDVAAVRSSWAPSAVWAAFTAGPYVGNPDSGEEGFDKGTLVINRGARPLLVNPAAALLRNTPGTTDGDQFSARIYEDAWSESGQRSLANILAVDGRGGQQSQIHTRAVGARTRLAQFENTRAYAYMSSTHLEDAYPRSWPSAVLLWQRQVLYLRPATFIIYDTTRTASHSSGQRLAFHVRGRPVLGRWGAATRADVYGRGGYAGSIISVLPAGAPMTVTDVFSSHKVYRLDITAPPGYGATRRWLTMVSAGSSPASGMRTTALNPRSSPGPSEGVLLTHPGWRNRVVVFVAGAGRCTYRMPDAASISFVIGLRPGRRYRVRVDRAQGEQLVVRLSSGGGLRASPAGILQFMTHGPSPAAQVHPIQRPVQPCPASPGQGWDLNATQVRLARARLR